MKIFHYCTFLREFPKKSEINALKLCDQSLENHCHTVGGRMGGDCIGSDLVPLSSGYDYMGMVISIGCGKAPSFEKIREPKVARIKYIITKDDMIEFERIKAEEPDVLVRYSEMKEVSDNPILKSADRAGYYITAR